MLEVANAYAKYQELMVQDNKMDFGDLQYYALRLVEKRPSVLRRLQEQYRYILVDEFQDTNYAQMKLVLRLAEQHGNVTVVGDDDQSIYKWRGASLSNIKAYGKAYPRADTVVLTKNYRSFQPILDASYEVIQNNNPERLEVEANIDKRLQSQRKGDVSGGGVEIHHFQHYYQEAAFVAETIENLIKDGSCSFGDVAILVRANRHADPFVQEFIQRGIPYSVRDVQGVWQQEAVKDVVAFLRFVAKPHDDVAFFRLLSLPIFGIEMSEILEVVRKAKSSDFQPVFYYLRDKLKDDSQAALPGLEGNSALKDTWALLAGLLEKRRNFRIGPLIGEFLERSGYYESLSTSGMSSGDGDDVLASHVGAEKLRQLSQFSEVVRSFELNEADGSITDFLEFIGSLEEAGGGASANDSCADAVSIVTVHSSKGLEFDTVFVPTLVKNRFPSVRRSEPLKIPDELIEESLPLEDGHLQEERRLFYVACTRAKSRLLLTYSDLYEGVRKWKPSPFIGEVLASGSVEEIDHTSKDAEEQEGRTHQGLALKEDVAVSPLEKKLEQLPEIKTGSLSYSRISTFEMCPLKYKFRYAFRIATPSPHAANFGSSVHNAVNEFYEALKEGSEPSLAMLLDLYEKQWINVGYESKGHEEARKLKGREMMERFYTREEEAGFRQPAYLERPFRLKVGRTMFTGRIDRIDKLVDGTYEVIDYKTGSSKRNAKLEKDLQLSLYALACTEVYGLKVSKLSLYFLDDSTVVSTSRSAEDLEAVREELKEISGEMAKSKFEATPGFPCGFCEYRPMCHKAV